MFCDKHAARLLRQIWHLSTTLNMHAGKMQMCFVVSCFFNWSEPFAKFCNWAEMNLCLSRRFLFSWKKWGAVSQKKWKGILPGAQVWLTFPCLHSQLVPATRQETNGLTSAVCSAGHKTQKNKSPWTDFSGLTQERLHMVSWKHYHISWKIYAITSPWFLRNFCEHL